MEKKPSLKERHELAATAKSAASLSTSASGAVASHQPPLAKRSLKNILIRPNQQIRYLLILVGCALGTLLSYVIFVIQLLRRQIVEIVSTYQLEPHIALEFTNALKWSAVGAITLALIALVSIAFAGLVMSHRLYGPLVPIERLIRAIANGDYKARGSLRKDDELQDLMLSLNTLAESLEKRHQRG